MNWQWLSIFLAQIGLGTFLYVQGDHDSARLMWASAVGQGVTAQIKARK